MWCACILKLNIFLKRKLTAYSLTNLEVGSKALQGRQAAFFCLLLSQRRINWKVFKWLIDRSEKASQGPIDCPILSQFILSLEAGLFVYEDCCFWCPLTSVRMGRCFGTFGKQYLSLTVLKLRWWLTKFVPNFTSLPSGSRVLIWKMNDADNREI